MTKIINPPELSPDNTAQIGHAFMQSTGLLWKINTDLLHPLGLALVVSLPVGTEYDPDDPHDPARTSGPITLLLMAAEDGEFEFTPEIDEARSKAWGEFLSHADAIRRGILERLGHPAPKEADDA